MLPFLANFLRPDVGLADDFRANFFMPPCRCLGTGPGCLEGMEDIENMDTLDPVGDGVRLAF